MHPTDTLISLIHARMARAAAAGPRHATQPTLKTKPRAYIAEGIADHWARLHTARSGLRALAEADGCFAREISAL